MASTALQRAAAGNISKMGAGQLKTGLTQAVKRLSSSKAAMQRARAQAAAGGLALATTVETQSTAFLSAMAEGYWGYDKVAPKGFHIPGIVGAVCTTVGVVQEFRGKNGAHFCGVGNGALAAATVSMGLRAGQKLARPDAGPRPTAIQGDGPLREVTVTPPPQPDTVAGPGRDRSAWRRVTVV